MLTRDLAPRACLDWVVPSEPLNVPTIAYQIVTPFIKHHISLIMEWSPIPRSLQKVRNLLAVIATVVDAHRTCRSVALVAGWLAAWRGQKSLQ